MKTKSKAVVTRRSPAKSSDSGRLPPQVALALYRQMLLIRRFELTAQKVLKAGEMPGFIHLYIGEEAVAAGVCAHLNPDDFITSTHRGHGHAVAKGVPSDQVLAELYGRSGGACGGRGGSMHIYAPRYGLLGTNGIVAGGLPSATGIGISAKVRKTRQVGVAFFGDGATNHGSFHESLNFAAAQKAQVVFVCENNLYATATPLKMATLNTEVASKAASYGMPGVAVDGNDVEAVYRVVGQAIARARDGGGPTLVECKTYRVVGHHEGDPLVGTYRTQEELDLWKGRCPIDRWRKRLLEEYRIAAHQLEKIEQSVEEEMAAALDYARKSPQPDPSQANAHVWASPLHPTDLPTAQGGTAKELTYVDAVRDAVAEEMRRDPNIIYMGEGTGERGGSFAHTKGLWHEFGAMRMIDTPISELAFTGAAIGAAGTGCRAVADLMFIDFLFEAASQVVNQAAKLRYMSNGQVAVPMVVRASWGSIKNAGPHHSGAYHPIWSHVPGLVVVIPSSPVEGKGLMKTALRCQDPVIFLEPKAIFAMKQAVPQDEYFIPFGVANVLRQGRHLTVVSCGTPVHRCMEAAQKLEQEGITCDVIDLRTIVPLDVDTICRSVEKTGRLLVVDEAYAMCGVGGEIAAAVMEQVFYSLESPITRLHPDPTAHPFSPAHENEVVVTVDKIVSAARNAMRGEPTPVRRLSAVVKGPKVTAAAATAAQPVAAAPASAKAAAPAAATAAAVDADAVPLKIPNMDLTITEAKIVRWLVEPGAAVKEGQEILEIETDKATSAVESPISGRLVQKAAKVDEVVKIGQVVGYLKA